MQTNTSNGRGRFDGLLADTAERRAFAQERLHAYIEQKRAVAQAVVNRVMDEVPVDQIARARVLDFAPASNGIWYQLPGQPQRRLHRNAVNQMAGRAGIPVRYLDHLEEPTHPGEAVPEWKRDLMAHTLREHFRHDEGRYLLRSVGDETRGFLSDRFKRIDCRPVVATLVEAATKLGALVVDGSASSIRSHLKVIVPRIIEPFPGEFVVWGLSWGNSDYGSGANEINMFVGRVWCWNGMVAEKTLRQIHLGRRLDDSIQYSDRTLDLDTKLAVSAAQDAVKHCLEEAQMNRFISAIQAANAAEVNGKAASEALAKRTSKDTAKRVVEAFNGADVVDLPPGNTDWRWANALSLVARDSEDADLKIDLEKLAGEVLSKHGLTAAT